MGDEQPVSAPSIDGSGDGCQVTIELDPEAAEDICDGEELAAAFVAPEPPEIPAFLDNVRLEQITPEIQRRLALALDLPSTSTSFKNWEWLASQLGMPAEEITYIRERARYPESPTLIVLRRYGRESFGGMLRLIRDVLSRYDVIIQLMPVLYAFEEHLQSSKAKGGAAVATNAAAAATAIPSSGGPSLPSVDSGIVDSMRATNVAMSGSVSQTVTGPSNGHRLFLITYADDNPQHRKLVLWLCKNLENLNAQAILDDSFVVDAGDDWMSRASDYFARARSIIVICSPAYFRCMEASSSSEEMAQAQDAHSQCSRFIYQLMCAEYRENNCRNRRFRPVIFDTAQGGMEIVPPILRNTVIHRWPRQHNELMKFLFPDS